MHPRSLLILQMTVKKRKVVSRVILLGILFILLATPFVIAFCNFDVKIDKEALDRAVAEGKLPANIYEGDQVVCFYSLVCPHCHKNAIWLERTRSLLHFKDVPLTVVFGEPSEPRIPQEFFDETGLEYNQMLYLEVPLFLEIVDNAWPKVLVLRNGKIFHKFTQRN